MAPQLHIKRFFFRLFCYIYFFVSAYFWAEKVRTEGRERSWNLKKVCTPHLFPVSKRQDSYCSLCVYESQCGKRVLNGQNPSLHDCPTIPSHFLLHFPCPLFFPSPTLTNFISPIFLLESSSSSRYSPPLQCHLSSYLPVQLQRKAS